MNMKQGRKYRWDDYLLMALVSFPALNEGLGYLIVPNYKPGPYDFQLYDLPIILFFGVLSPTIYRWFQGKLRRIKNPTLNRVVAAGLTFFVGTTIPSLTALWLRELLY